MASPHVPSATALRLSSKTRFNMKGFHGNLALYGLRYVGQAFLASNLHCFCQVLDLAALEIMEGNWVTSLLDMTSPLDFPRLTSA